MAQDMSPGEGTPTPPSGSENLRRAFRAVVAGNRSANAELRRATSDFVRELKTRGSSPEATVIAVKDVMRRALAGQTPTHDHRRETDALVERVVTWCIEEYYQGGDGAGVAS